MEQQYRKLHTDTIKIPKVHNEQTTVLLSAVILLKKCIFNDQIKNINLYAKNSKLD